MCVALILPNPPKKPRPDFRPENPEPAEKNEIAVAQRKRVAHEKFVAIRIADHDRRRMDDVPRGEVWDNLVAKQIPLGKLGLPRDIAAGVLLPSIVLTLSAAANEPAGTAQAAGLAVQSVFGDQCLDVRAFRSGNFRQHQWRDRE